MMLVVRDRTMAYHDRIVGRVHVEPASLDLAAECRHVRKSGPCVEKKCRR